MRNCTQCTSVILPTEASIMLANADRVCALCARKYATCAWCDHYALAADMLETVHDGEICADCRGSSFRDSDHEGGLIPRDYARRTVDNRLIDTRHTEYYTHDDGSVFADICLYDEYCAEQESEENRGLLPFDACAIAYTSASRDRRDFANSKLPYMGFELETEANDTPRAVVNAMGGNCSQARQWILKEDGSLAHGQEFVTAPMTLAAHVAHDWEKELDTLREHAEPDDTCGLHVHLNLRSLSQLVLGKMLVFVNSPATTTLIHTVAGRSSSQWAARYPKKLKDGYGYENKDGKYCAMNVGARTVEFRIFASTLKQSGLYRALEFVDSLRAYMQTCSMRDAESPVLFCEWVRERRATYPNLAEFFVRKGYTKAFRKPKPRTLAA